MCCIYRSSLKTCRHLLYKGTYFSTTTYRLWWFTFTQTIYARIDLLVQVGCLFFSCCQLMYSN